MDNNVNNCFHLHNNSNTKENKLMLLDLVYRLF